MKRIPLLFTILLVLVYFNCKSQTYVFYATVPESFLDSTCTKKIRKLTKGEVMLVENLIPYKKKYLYAHCIKDGKAGFIDKSHIKMEKTYFPDSTGKDPLIIAKQEYKNPDARIINTSAHAILKISFGGKTFILKPDEKEEFYSKPGPLSFKVETRGYQPLYTNEVFYPFHITEIDLFIE